MLSGAIDIEESSTDRKSGRGLVSAFNALNKVGAKPAVSLAQGAVTVHPLGSDVVLPGGAGQVTVAINNGGGAAATAVSATLTSSSPNVLLLQGSATYPTIAAESSATGTTAFAFFVNAATPCGAMLPFTLTVSYTGNAGQNPRPAVFQFNIVVGRPGAAMHFAYAGGPVAIPDANPAGVDVPLAVSEFSGSVAKAVFNIDGTACSAAIGSTTAGVDHTWVGDLTFTLTSPGGRTVKLLNRAGGALNSGNNFCQTFLDDAATSPIQAITVAQEPFTGRFSPLQPLSAFLGDTGSGTWILHATDNSFLDTGSVRAFSLDLSGFSCTK